MRILQRRHEFRRFAQRWKYDIGIGVPPQDVIHCKTGDSSVAIFERVDHADALVHSDRATQNIPFIVLPAVTVFLRPENLQLELFHEYWNSIRAWPLDRAANKINSLGAIGTLLLLHRHSVVLTHDCLIQMACLAVLLQPIEGFGQASRAFMQPEQGHGNECLKNPASESSGLIPILPSFLQVAAGLQEE